MSLISLELPWDSQPQEAVPLSDALGATPIVAWLGSSPAVGPDGRAWTRSASLTDGAGPAGRHVTFVGNTSNAFTRTGGSTSSQKRFFALSVFRWTSGAANNFSQLLADSTGNNGWRVGAGTGAGGDLLLVKGSVAVLPNITLSSGVWYVMATSHWTDTGEYYMVAVPLNGGTLLRATGTNTSSAAAGNGTVAVGTGRTDFTGAWNGDIALAVAAYTWIPEAQALELINAPWRLFQDRRIPVPASAGGGGNVTVALTGASVTASAGTLTASSTGGGSAALIGEAATFSPGVFAPSVTIALTGIAATMSAGILSASSGSATITVKAGSWLRYKKLS